MLSFLINGEEISPAQFANDTHGLKSLPG